MQLLALSDGYINVSLVKVFTIVSTVKGHWSIIADGRKLTSTFTEIKDAENFILNLQNDSK